MFTWFSEQVAKPNCSIRLGGYMESYITKTK